MRYVIAKTKSNGLNSIFNTPLKQECILTILSLESREWKIPSCRGFVNEYAGWSFEAVGMSCNILEPCRELYSDPFLRVLCVRERPYWQLCAKLKYCHSIEALR